MKEVQKAVANLLEMVPINKPVEHASHKEQMEALIAFLDDLIERDFNKLVGILYRVDVPEEKVKKALANARGELSSGHIIARLLIEREAQKIITRAKYRKGKL